MMGPSRRQSTNTTPIRSDPKRSDVGLVRTDRSAALHYLVSPAVASRNGRMETRQCNPLPKTRSSQRMKTGICQVKAQSTYHGILDKQAVCRMFGGTKPINVATLYRGIRK